MLASESKPDWNNRKRDALGTGCGENCLFLHERLDGVPSAERRGRPEKGDRGHQ
jgi:hypothetical protein